LRKRAGVLSSFLLLTLLLLSGLPIAQDHPAAAAPAATNTASLSVTVVPPTLPADNSSYPAVVVSLVKGGAATVAVNSTTVYLTSSEQAIGTVTPQVTIGVGQAYAIANFTTTKTAGATTITATAPGVTSVSAQLTTMVADGYPTQLVITAVPAEVPANAVAAGSSTGHLLLELVDDAGLPAKAVADTTVSLYSSNTKVVNVSDSQVTMEQGQFLQLLNYTSGFVPGAVSITASATEFETGQTTVTVLGFPPLSLKLYAQPSAMVTCTSAGPSCVGRLVVEMTDLNGNPTRAQHDTVVQLRSSDLNVLSAPANVTILAGSISAVANYSVTSQPGTATITASAPNLASGFAAIVTTTPNYVSPSYCLVLPPGDNTSNTNCSLVVYAGPDPVLADDNSYSSVVVALVSEYTGANGSALGSALPAISANGPTQITLTSSVTGVGNFTSITFDIPQGQNWAAVTFTSTFQVGTTQLTASGDDLTSDQTTLETYGPVPAQIVLTPLSTVLPADGQSHYALELALENSLGAPAVAASDVAVNLTSSETGVVGVKPAIIPAGDTDLIVNATTGVLSGSATVTAFYESANASVTTSSSAALSTIIPPPSMLGVYPVASSIISVPGQAAPPIVLQLQDASGNPARARADTNFTITSSNSTVLPNILSATVLQGQDYALLKVTPAVPGTTTLTIFATGLEVSSLTLNFLPFPGSQTISGGPLKIFANQTSVLDVTVTLGGVGLPNVPVEWTATGGGLISATTRTSPTASQNASGSSNQTSTTSRSTTQPLPERELNDTTNNAGDSTMIFKPSGIGSVFITAKVDEAGVPAAKLVLTIQVVGAPAGSKGHSTIAQQLTSFPLVLGPIGGGAGAVAAFVLLKRRGKGGSPDEEFENALD
jgi:hypothetical protein